MKHTTRIGAWTVTLLFCLAALLVLVACNTTGDTNDTSAADTPAAEAPTEAPTEADTACEEHAVIWQSKDEHTHEGTCSVCGQAVTPAEHEWDEGTVTVEPTVEAEGTKVFRCTVCGCERTESVEKLPTIKEILGLEINMSDIKEPLMQPIFSGTVTKNETVMFLDKGDVKSLLYPIESIQSVTSYDGKRVYEEGKDYELVDGKIKVTENSAIPCITSAKFYNSPGSIINVSHDGKTVPMHWGEGRTMTDWQVNVNYTHPEGWEGFVQPCELETYQNFVKKLQNGEDVTVFFYGDSITNGASASYLYNYPPYQATYPMLFTQTLADLFGYTVHYEAGGVAGAPMVPSTDYVGGDRGTITFVNTAVGGWTSQNGVENIPEYITKKIEAYGCDLFVVAYGMNDAAVTPRMTSRNTDTIMKAVLEVSPNASIVLLATMVPNPAGIGWYGNQPKQEAEFQKLAKIYMQKDVPCAVCCMTSVSLSILEHKEFHDYSGNNINHPNDYYARVYAQVLLQTVIGFENMN